MKEESIGKPNIYLGNRISLVALENGVDVCALSSARYIKSDIENVKKVFEAKGLKLPKQTTSPFSVECRPELDISI